MNVVIMIIVLIQMLFLSQRIWNKWIKNLQHQVKDFELEEVSKSASALI